MFADLSAYGFLLFFPLLAFGFLGHALVPKRFHVLWVIRIMAAAMVCFGTALLALALAKSGRSGWVPSGVGQAVFGGALMLSGLAGVVKPLADLFPEGGLTRGRAASMAGLSIVFCLFLDPPIWGTIAGRSELRTLASGGISALTFGNQTVRDPKVLAEVARALAGATSSELPPWGLPRGMQFAVAFKDGPTRFYLVTRWRNSLVIAEENWGPGLHQALVESPILFDLLGKLLDQPKR